MATVPPQSYRLHGISVRVSSDDPAVLGRVRPVFDHLGLEEAQSCSAAAALELSLSVRSTGLSVPAGARELARQDGIGAWSLGDRIYLSTEDHALCLDPSSGRGVGVLPPSSSKLRKDVLLYGLLLLLHRRGYLGLHASGVGREGAGYLLLAKSGSGKSTHTYSLVRRGWSYLGDDVVLLRSRGAQVEALALRRDLCLDPALARHFPEVLTHGDPGPFAGRGKWLLRMRRLHADRLIDRCVPRVLVFPEIVAEPESRLVPLEPAAALYRLVQQTMCMAADPRMMASHFERLGHLVRQARSYQLLAGRDAEQEPALIETLLSAVQEPLPNSGHPEYRNASAA